MGQAHGSEHAEESKWRTSFSTMWATMEMHSTVCSKLRKKGCRPGVGAGTSRAPGVHPSCLRSPMDKGPDPCSQTHIGQSRQRMDYPGGGRRCAVPGGGQEGTGEEYVVHVVNAYFQGVGREGRHRQAERGRWDDILTDGGSTHASHITTPTVKKLVLYDIPFFHLTPPRFQTSRPSRIGFPPLFCWITRDKAVEQAS